MQRLGVLLFVGSMFSFAQVASAGHEDNWTSKNRLKFAAEILLQRAEAVFEAGPTKGPMRVHAKLTRHFADKLVEALNKGRHPAVIRGRFLAAAVHWRLTDMFYQKKKGSLGAKLVPRMRKLERAVYRTNYNLHAGRIAKATAKLDGRMAKFAAETGKVAKSTFLSEHSVDVRDQLSLVGDNADERIGFLIFLEDFELLRAMYCASEEATRSVLQGGHFKGKYKINSRAAQAQVAFRQLHREVLTAIPHVLTSGKAGIWKGCGIKGFLHGPIHSDGGGFVIGTP